MIRIKEKIKKIISLFWPIIVALILLIPLPYTVTVGGGSLNISDTVSIENNNTIKGSYNLTYVKTLKGNVLTYLLGKIIPNYEVEKVEESTLEEETVKEYYLREKILFDNTLTIAAKVAYEAANKEFKIISTNLIIAYIDPLANTNLEIGDKILEIAGVPIDNYQNLRYLIDSYKVEEAIDFKVLRDDKEIICQAKIINIDGEKIIGIYVITNYEYEASPSISFDTANDLFGSSGGLMYALEIYDQLSEEDLAKGRIISGTGTIDEDGIIGEIAGVKEKLIGATKINSDIFFVPDANYDEALAIKEKEGYNINIVSITTFANAVEYLQKTQED